MSATTVTERTYIGPAFADAKVSDAMRVGVVTCRPDTSLADAARIMTGYRIHCLIVTDPQAGPHARSWGVVDALDVARAEAEGRTGAVGEIAATELVTIDSSAR